MTAEFLNDLAALTAVVREKSFTRAAKQLGVSQSALSQTIRTLEARLGVRLLTRTTRSVSPTEAGERLLQSIGPHLEGIELAIDQLSALRDKPAGTVRLIATEYCAEAIVWPPIRKVLAEHPDITIEIMVDFGLTDIVSERFDAGVRMGGMISRDMIAVPISPKLRMAVAGALQGPIKAKSAKRPDRT